MLKIDDDLILQRYLCRKDLSKKFGWERRIYLRSSRLKGREEGKRTENIKPSFVRFVITTRKEEIRQRMRTWHKRIFAITDSALVGECAKENRCDMVKAVLVVVLLR